MQTPQPLFPVSIDKEITTTLIHGNIYLVFHNSRPQNAYWNSQRNIFILNGYPLINVNHIYLPQPEEENPAKQSPLNPISEIIGIIEKLKKMNTNDVAIQSYQNVLDEINQLNITNHY